MLSFAINIADDCCFFILVDGVDEFQSHEQPGEEHLTAADLVDFFYEIQKPPNVKLCVSSRPEIRIIERYPSFLETNLAVLNCDDIRTFASEQLSALPGLDHKWASSEICRRADGMFMWAVFALREIKDGHTFKESLPELLERLNNMGPSLTTAISHMLRNIDKRHMTRVAFYLQAIGSWITAGDNNYNPWGALSVAVITASRLNCDIDHTLEFLTLCQEEERNLRICARGLIEIQSIWRKNRVLLVNPLQFPQDYPDDMYKREIPRNFRDTYPGLIVPADSHLSRVFEYCDTSVSFVHRSAYDFFFSETDEDNRRAARTLMNCNNATEVPARLQNAIYQLSWIQPFVVSPDTDSAVSRHALICDLESRVAQPVWYTASGPFTQEQRVALLDELISDMRLRLLPPPSRAPPYEQREHVPGDIFSHWMSNGQLQLLDEDESYDLESSESLNIVARCEAEFWLCCERYTCLNIYFRDRVHALHRTSLGRLVLAEILQRSRARDNDYGSISPMPIVLKSLESWTTSLLRRHQLVNLPWLIGRWLLGSNILGPMPKTRDARLSELCPGSGTACSQWCPFWSTRNEDFSEVEVARASISTLWHAVNAFDLDLLRTISFVLNPWDAWVALLLEGESDTPPLIRSPETRLFISVNAVSAWHLEGRMLDALNPRCLSEPYITHRLIQSFTDNEGAASVLFHHDLDASTNQRLEQLCHMYMKRTLTQAKVDAIIADVLRSTTLSHAQKDGMVENIQGWPISSTYV
jgi:hypothetical protein